jgi:hypothetical protein
MSRSSMGAHQRRAFAANVAGRRKVYSSPEVSISRSIRSTHAPDMLRNPLQSENDSGGRGGPHKEHGIDAIQTTIKALGTSEISMHRVNLSRQSSRIGVASHGADLLIGGRQSRDNCRPTFPVAPITRVRLMLDIVTLGSVGCIVAGSEDQAIESNG